MAVLERMERLTKDRYGSEPNTTVRVQLASHFYLIVDSVIFFPSTQTADY